MTPTALLLPALLALHAPAALAAEEGAAGGGKAKAAFVPEPELTGLVQTWLTVMDQDEDPTADPSTYGDPEDDPGLKLRRARVGMEGDGQQVRYAVVVGVGSPYDNASTGAFVGQNGELGLVDAAIGVKLAEPLWVDLGLQKLPISREQLVSSRAIALGERSVGTSALIPEGGRDAGLTLDLKAGDSKARGRLRAGVYNGNGSELGDMDPGKLVAARAEGALGSGAAYKTHGSVEELTLSLAGDFWMDDDRATRTTGYGADFMARIAGLAFTCEYRMATITPTDTTVDVPGVLGDTHRVGWMAQLGYTVGQVEPVVRWSAYDDHTGLDDNGDVSEGGFGLNWVHESDQLRAGAHYLLRLEDAGRTIPNDTARLWLELSI